MLAHDCGISPEQGATFASLASRKWPILNLGLRFSNKCGVRLNVRRMDGFISMIILEGKRGWPTAQEPVCTENSILIDYVTESPNVSGDDRSIMLLPDPVRLAVQVEEPT